MLASKGCFAQSKRSINDTLLSKLELSVPGTNHLVGRNLEETPTLPSALIGSGEKEILVVIVAD